MKQYNLFCKKCKSKTPHIISNLSRKKGVKLSCLLCGTERSKYINFQKLGELQNE